MSSILVIGSGGREHAIAWKLSQSPNINHIFVCPGNAGIDKIEKCNRLDLDINYFDDISNWCLKQNIQYVVVGSENILAKGISDHLNNKDIKCFGPTSRALTIESSKVFAKNLMKELNIPTAKWSSFNDSDAAIEFINKSSFNTWVVKANGLTSGKGVFICKTKTEAISAILLIMNKKLFGDAGKEIIIEEFLEGEEVSLLAFTDGINIKCMLPVRDHKRLLEWDRGPNTGGMGAYCPSSIISDEDVLNIEKNILKPVINGLAKDNRHFIGVIYCGLMITDNGPYVLEFNGRFGDPETQVLLPLLKTDLHEIIVYCLNCKLSEIDLEFDNGYAVATVVVSKGYPSSSEKGREIFGLKSLPDDIVVFQSGTSWEGDSLITTGGRILSIVCVEETLKLAIKNCFQSVKIINFDGMYYRRDIGFSAIRKTSLNKLTYIQAGVDNDKSELVVDIIKPLAKRTARRGTLSEIGLFAGVFDLKLVDFKDPLLISSADGVGTKLLIAQECGIYDTIGIDLVAMCVNYIITHCGKPLFFLDYIASGSIDGENIKKIMKGITEGCIQAKCSLIGGETAEMPGLYHEGNFDVAGFVLGATEREDYLPRIGDINEGDVLIGIPSNGLHSNGFSLVRKVMESSGYKYDDICPYNKEKTIGEALLEPTMIYDKTLLSILKSKYVKGFSHITGGGIPGNLKRILPENLIARLDANTWSIHSVFGWLSAVGNIPDDDMINTFNCGIGGIMIVDEKGVENVINNLKSEKLEFKIIGELVNIDYQLQSPSKNKLVKNKIVIYNFENRLYECKKEFIQKTSNKSNRKKVAVLISGKGTNLQAIIDGCLNPTSPAEVRLVISNVEYAKGLDKALLAGIPAEIIKHSDYKCRTEFDLAVNECLENYNIELICLAGFMRILGKEFVDKWPGKILNIHPSLLPLFKGINVHKRVLESGVRVSGCTVHFVDPEVDSGAIICQESVVVLPNDDEETLCERIKIVEHKAFSHALQLVATGQVKLDSNKKIQWKLNK